MQRNSILSVLVVAALSIGAVGCGSDSTGTDAADESAELTISDARSREPASGTTLGVVYGVVTNPGDTDVQIESGSASVTDDVELHDVEMSDGAMSMFEVEEGFTVPAGGQFVFEPGGPHIMLLGVDPATYPDEVEVTLNLSDGGPLTFTAPVEAIGESTGTEMQDGDMDGSGGEMEMDDEG